MTQADQTAPAPANKGVKQGLPSMDLPAAEGAAMKLWNVARLGTTTKQAFASAVGRKSASGGSWDMFLAALRGYGLVEVNGGQIGLSPIGQQVVNPSDPEKQRAARRTAITTLKAYRELVTAFEGTPPPSKEALAGRLQFEYGKQQDVAAKAAQAFLSSIVHADMIDAAGNVTSSGANVGPSPERTNASDESSKEEPAAKIDRAEEAEDSDHGLGEIARGALSRRLENRGSPVTLALSLDLSRFEAAEIIEILCALGLATHD
ncbi:MAG TPA: hypothetical protein VJ851_05410 [Jatrophihabitans sp.]|nr:hypothetical protein [Jatrophihabitans sp.]